MEETDRNFARADELLDQAEQLAPGNPNILLERAVLRGRTRAYDEALTILEQLGNAGGLGTNELLEKGRLLDRSVGLRVRECRPCFRRRRWSRPET